MHLMFNQYMTAQKKLEKKKNKKTKTICHTLL